METTPITPVSTPTIKQELTSKPNAGNKPITSRKKRCGQCAGCTTPDCGKCRFCADKKKYGGTGRLKKGCIHRQCIGGKPTSTSSQSSTCATKYYSQAVSGPLSQASVPQVSCAQLNHTGALITPGKHLYTVAVIP